MELIEGETLAARLSYGALPLDRALAYAGEIASALDRAHRAGIVHRDIKPANVMVTKSGIKLLDFGLAKLKAIGGPISMSGIEGQRSTAIDTAHGTLLGTVPYMAPEQVEGKEADARADIWALGAVLYEMVTGVRPFEGESPASVIGAILKDVPAPVSSRQPVAPRALDDVVAGCLAKDPDERWQNAGDVGRLLTRIANSPSTGSESRVRHGAAWKERAAWATVAVLLLAALAYVTLRGRPVAPAGEVVRLSVNPPGQTVFTALTAATVPTPQFTVSPDGRSIAFVAGSSSLDSTLWLRSLDDTDARALAGTDDAQEPFWSPDSRWIGFFDGQGRLKRVSVSGGSVQTIASATTDPRGASWGPDDTILFGTGYGGVYRVSAAGGTPQLVTELKSGEGSHRWPQFLPDGRHFLFTVRGPADQRGVNVGAVDGLDRRLLIRNDGNARYAPPGYLFFLDEDTLLAQSFDTERLELAGQPMPVAVRVGRNSRGDGAFSTSSAATLAYAGTSLRPGRLTWFDRGGNPLGVVGPDGAHDYADFRLSPDESRLAASRVDPAVSVPNVWITDLRRGGTSPFTLGPALNAAAIWSPDDQRLVFRSTRNGQTELYQKSAGAGGNEQPLLTMAAARTAFLWSSNLVAADWSADGQSIALVSGSPTDIWLLPLAGEKTPVSLVRSPADQMHANFSPDGKFIAYTSNESGRYDVYVETLPTSDRKWPISTNGGYEPRWRADGREIYYLSEDRTLMAVAVVAGAVPFGVPRPLFQTDVHPGVNVLRTHYVPSRDGSRFLINTRSRDLAPVSITVMLNWTAALKK
jgi:Tol biopolymer transport system component